MTTHDDNLENLIQIFTPEDYIVIDDLPDETIDLGLLSSPNYEQIERRVIELTNLERQKHHLQPLEHNEILCRSALLHTLDMAEHHFISHTGSDGSTVAERVQRAGYNHALVVGENLAMGYLDPESAVRGWMESPGHRANILRPQFTQIGVGYIYGFVQVTNGNLVRGCYWTQHFGRPMSFPPLF